ncbi:MAG TPA: xanthine dehydrogenase family protein molybdopterin-binding subunit [Xanthobacteraceae bacterium]|nr:xanthine dehydrogenase family protein molybdopterin-binding subunit [Xanthobacteraceae bacterium]
MEALNKFTGTGIGAPMQRVEDRRFVTGKGDFVDDFALPQMAVAYVVRSPHAHARIVRIDKGPACAVPGVFGVLTGHDVVAENIKGLPCPGFPVQPVGSRYYRPLRPVLASDFVRHVGDGVALIIAQTLHQANDAAELLAVDYEVLPAVTLEDALAQGAPKVWQDAPSNVSFQLERGERRTVDQAFAQASHVTRLSLHYPRVTANTIEPRSVVAYREAGQRFTLRSTTQTPYRLREVASDILRMPELDLRVVSPDVGGGFGMKSQVYPEEILVLWAARKLDRPVKLVVERSDAIASDAHGRHQIVEAELALDANARILAVRSSVSIDLGAYLSVTAASAPNNATNSLTGTYVVPLMHVVVKAVFTNTAMMASYRGTAKPEASFVMERLVDKAARELGIDPVDMRRRNLIPPTAMPHKTAGGLVYDCGEFEKVLDSALELADWTGFAKRRTESERRGLRRGIGLALHCQRAGNQSERMEIRVAPNGSVALHVGTHSHGQSHETAFAQMINEWLGVEPDQVTLFQGDTDKVLFGRGTFSQRSMSTGGSALQAAADIVIAKGKRLAGLILEASEEDIDFKSGVFLVRGTDRTVAFKEVAKKSYQGMGLPAEFGIGLDGAGTHPGPFTFPNGCMICEVEVDTDTGTVAVVRLSAVDDVGTVVNPLTLEGQLHGSTAQGLGETLLEQVVYQRGSGQLITGSFQDYAMPRADNMPAIVSSIRPVPTKLNPLGAKGGSEPGNVGAPAAIINAIVDALSSYRVTDVPMPATPERIWQLIHGARE